MRRYGGNATAGVRLDPSPHPQRRTLNPRESHDIRRSHYGRPSAPVSTQYHLQDEDPIYMSVHKMPEAGLFVHDSAESPSDFRERRLQETFLASPVSTSSSARKHRPDRTSYMPPVSRREETHHTYGMDMREYNYYGGLASYDYGNKSAVNQSRTSRDNPTGDTPIMFRDPFDGGSVGTGMSQQELLRRKARDHSKRRKEKKYKKKKEKKIVNIPINLLGGAVATPPRKGYSPRDSGDAIKRRQSPAPSHQRLNNIRSKSSEDFEMSTAETTNTSSLEARLKAIDLPYSTVPLATTALYESDGEGLILRNEPMSNFDSKSFGEEESLNSFPYLSNHHSSRFSVTSASVHEPAKPLPTLVESPDKAAPNRVRFSKKIADYSREVSLEPSEGSRLPWDERTDDQSPTSVLSYREGGESSPSSSKRYPTGSRKSIRPKSILRASRFSGPVRGRYLYFDRMNSASGLVSEGSGPQEYLSSPRPTTDYASTIARTPSPESFFHDSRGADLSPIRPSSSSSVNSPPRVSPEMAPPLPHDPRVLGHPAEKHMYSPSVILREASTALYPEPASYPESELYSESDPYRESDAYLQSDPYSESDPYRVSDPYQQSDAYRDSDLYPDPPLDMQMLDDESTAVSTHVTFMESVASIVIQSAFRRYLAMQLFRRLLRRMKRQQSRQLQEAENQKQIQEYNMAAVRIQSAFRGFWVRDSMSVDQYCATVIQKGYRCHIQRVTYFYDLFRITVVQSIWRRNIVRDYVSDYLARVLTVQAVYRGYRSRKIEQERKRRESAVKTSRNSLYPSPKETPMHPTTTEVSARGILYPNAVESSARRSLYPNAVDYSQPSSRSSLYPNAVQSSEPSARSRLYPNAAQSSEPSAHSSLYSNAVESVDSPARISLYQNAGLPSETVTRSSLYPNAGRPSEPVPRSNLYPNAGQSSEPSTPSSLYSNAPKSPVPATSSSLYPNTAEPATRSSLDRNTEKTSLQKKASSLLMSETAARQFDAGSNAKEHKENNFGVQEISKTSPEMEYAATKIQAQWRAFTGETIFIGQVVDVLISQTVVRRWIAIRRVSEIRKKQEMVKHAFKTFRSAQEAGSPKEPAALERSVPVFTPNISRPVKLSSASTDRMQSLRKLAEQQDSKTSKRTADQKMTAPVEVVADTKENAISEHHRVAVPCLAMPNNGDRAEELTHIDTDGKGDLSSEPDISTVGTRSLLSMWKEKDKKNTMVIGSGRSPYSDSSN